MVVALIIVTRNSSAAVKTLHSILNINSYCIQKNVQIEINFVDDDPFERVKMIMKKIKSASRIIFIDYGCGLDIETTKRSLSPIEQGWHGVVFPVVLPGIDWDMFKTKIKKKSSEPISQSGLNFDTHVSKPITGEDNYRVVNTVPKCWAIETKPLLKNLKGPKGTGLSIPAQNKEMFEKFLEKGIKLYAYTASNIVISYQHECIGNILNMTGVTKD